MTRPGTRLRALAKNICDQQTMERLIDPAIADLQCEHAEAIRRGQIWRSRCVRIAGYGAVAKVAAIGLGRTSIDIWSEADGAVGRTVRFAGIATVAIAVLLEWPPISNYWPRIAIGQHAWMVCTLIPQALVTAIPLGLMVGIFSGLRGRVVGPRVMRLLIALGVACCVAMFVLVGWLLPAANQAFRMLASNVGPVSRGINELTIRELASGHLTRRLPISGGLTLTRRAFNLNFRLALASAPLTLGLFALGVTMARRKASGRRFIGAIATTSCLTYYVLLFTSRLPSMRAQATDPLSQHIPAIVAAWSPNLLFLALALMLFCLRSAPDTREAHS